MKLEIELRDGFNPDDYEQLKKMLDTFMQDVWTKPYWSKENEDDIGFHIHVIDKKDHILFLEEVESKYEQYQRCSNNVNGIK